MAGKETLEAAVNDEEEERKKSLAKEEDDDDDGEEWQEVGPKNKSTITRRVSYKHEHVLVHVK